MRQAVVARSFCAGRSHGIASRRLLPGSRNAPLASLPQCLLLGSRKTPRRAAHATRPLRVFRNASCWAHAAPCRAQAMRLAELTVKLCPSPTPFTIPSKAWQSPSARLWKETGVRPGNRSNRREPERSVQEPEQSDEEPHVRVGEPLPSESKDRPRQNRRTSAPESEDQPHLIAKTPTWRTSKPQFSSRICILGVAGLPYNL